MSHTVITEIDEFFEIVKDKGDITLEEVSTIMEAELELVERWARALHEVGMLSVHYPTFSTNKAKARIKFRDDSVKVRRSPVQGFLMHPQ